LHALGAGASANSQATGTEMTDAEISDLRSVAAMLGLPTSAADHALRPSDAGVPRQPVRRFALSAGDMVVFTGQVFTGHTPQPREEMERRAIAAGLRVARSVERDARLLVAADVDTMSVKARTARDYGVPIVSAATFDRFLAAMSDKHRGQVETAPSDPVSRRGVDDD
jgi:DNA polymerase-3 subunit epsilon